MTSSWSLILQLLDLFSGLPASNIAGNTTYLGWYFFIPLHSVVYCQPIPMLYMVIAANFGDAESFWAAKRSSVITKKKSAFYETRSFITIRFT